MYNFNSRCAATARNTKSKPSEAGSIWKGRRNLRIYSFRGSYANRGSAAREICDDAAVAIRSLVLFPSPVPRPAAAGGFPWGKLAAKLTDEGR